MKRTSLVRNKGIARAKKELKRAEANVRQVERGKRTAEAQLALLDSRGFAAVKERKRLLEGSSRG